MRNISFALPDPLKGFWLGRLRLIQPESTQITSALLNIFLASAYAYSDDTEYDKLMLVVGGVAVLAALTASSVGVVPLALIAGAGATATGVHLVYTNAECTSAKEIFIRQANLLNFQCSHSALSVYTRPETPTTLDHFIENNHIEELYTMLKTTNLDRRTRYMTCENFLRDSFKYQSTIFNPSCVTTQEANHTCMKLRDTSECLTEYAKTRGINIEDSTRGLIPSNIDLEENLRDPDLRTRRRGARR